MKDHPLNTWKPTLRSEQMLSWPIVKEADLKFSLQTEQTEKVAYTEWV